MKYLISFSVVCVDKLTRIVSLICFLFNPIAMSTCDAVEGVLQHAESVDMQI